MTGGRWGRSDAAGRWPHPKPVWSAAALTLAFATATAAASWQYAVRWTPLQRVYLGAYVRSGLMETLGFTTAGRYRLLYVVTPTGPRLALDEEVRRAADRTAEASLVLTDIAEQTGVHGPVWEEASYAHTALHDFLRRWFYRDRALETLVRPALWIGFITGFIALVVAIPKDLARARARRQGQRLKGPELVSHARFNRGVSADGLAFTQRSRGLQKAPVVRIPRALESSHVLIMGDSGTGKSVLIRQILQQLEARGETAIVYDPALEYTGQFYSPERGDRILNPLDARCPYWTPGNEWRHEAETLTLATSLFPDRHHENTFFTEAPRRIFAHLLTCTPSPQELAAWLCDGVKIDGLLAGTPYATMIDRQAPAQRAGVLASLNMVADTLKLLPRPNEASPSWSATQWAIERRGWLFLTSTPETRPRLVPLTSLWLDTLVLRLMNQGRPARSPTWFILDELASLQRLPQLHTAITENRKSNNPVVLGFQGRSQLETRYGHDAETMLSQPATKIFLRTSEPRAARWIAETIGEIEIERLRESRSSGRGTQQSYGLERQVEPLVMPSEISGLPALRGFLKLGNLVVRMDVPFVDRPAQARPFIESERITRRAASRTDETTQGARPTDVLTGPTFGQRQEQRLLPDATQTRGIE